MNLRDLTYIIAVADHTTMARAAMACHVGQPTLSIQIKKLEDYLGIEIFERTNKHLRVTEAGKAIIAIARTIVADSNRLRETAQRLSDPFTLPLRLGVFPTLAPYLLPHIMPALHARFPNLTLHLVEEKSPILLEQLMGGALDAALLSLPLEATDLEFIPLFDDPFYLACATTHPWAQRKTITRRDLQGQELLLLDEGHCMRNQALEVCSATRAAESNVFRATSLETLRHMVASGTGMTLIPRIAATPTPNLTYIPFRKGDAPSRAIGLVIRKTVSQRPFIRALATEIAKTATKA